MKILTVLNPEAGHGRADRELDEIEATAEPKILSPDGELAGTTPAEITCLHRAPRVYQ